MEKENTVPSSVFTARRRCDICGLIFGDSFCELESYRIHMDNHVVERVKQKHKKDYYAGLVRFQDQ